MKDSKLFKSLVATFVIIVLGGPAVVLAGTPFDFEDAKVTVSYVDLNLENEEGVQTLYRRLQRASKQASGFASLKVLGSVQRMQKTRQYYRELLSNAVENIDNERLSEIHAGSINCIGRNDYGYRRCQ